MQLLTRYLILLLLILPMPLIANDAVRQALTDYAWKKRQLVVFSPDKNHSEYQSFERLEDEFRGEFIDRRLQVWRILTDQIVTLENQPRGEINSHDFYQHFQVSPNDFRLLLIGYDQGEKLRQKTVDIDNLFSEIDQMPMRQQEMTVRAEPKKESQMEGQLIDDVRRDDMQSVLGGKWQMVSDQVMGGVSDGTMLLAEKAGRRCLQLQGNVSTENNGGFLQLALNLNQGKSFDASAFKGIKIEVFGNGEDYNLHLRTKGLWFPWQAYRSSFNTQPKWQNIELPFAEFQAYKTSKSLNTAELRRIGLVAIGKDFTADVCLGAIGFYK